MLLKHVCNRHAGRHWQPRVQGRLTCSAPGCGRDGKWFDIPEIAMAEMADDITETAESRDGIVLELSVECFLQADEQFQPAELGKSQVFREVNTSRNRVQV